MGNELTTGTDRCVIIRCVLRADGMKPPFTVAADVLMVATPEFVMGKVGASRIAMMSGVDISEYTQKERVGSQAKNREYILEAEGVETSCTLMNFLLTLAMLFDYMHRTQHANGLHPCKRG